MTSRFNQGEIQSIVIAWLVLSVGITYSHILGLVHGNQSDFEMIVAGFTASATGFIFHELGHKYVAIRHGYTAHFQIWLWGIVLTLVTAVVSGGGFLFGAPGAVYIAPAAIGTYGYGYYSSNYKITDQDYENMIISAAGPSLNLAFAIFFFFMLYFSSANSFMLTLGIYGFGLNVGLGSFNMLPIPPLDGSKIFRKNPLIALAIAVPLWALFVYFFLL